MPEQYSQVWVAHAGLKKVSITSRGCLSLRDHDVYDVYLRSCVCVCVPVRVHERVEIARDGVQRLPASGADWDYPTGAGGRSDSAGHWQAAGAAPILNPTPIGVSGALGLFSLRAIEPTPAGPQPPPEGHWQA